MCDNRINDCRGRFFGFIEPKELHVKALANNIHLFEFYLYEHKNWSVI